MMNISEEELQVALKRAWQDATSKMDCVPSRNQEDGIHPRNEIERLFICIASDYLPQKLREFGLKKTIIRFENLSTSCKKLEQIILTGRDFQIPWVLEQLLIKANRDGRDADVSLVDFERVLLELKATINSAEFAIKYLKEMRPASDDKTSVKFKRELYDLAFLLISVWIDHGNHLGRSRSSQGDLDRQDEGFSSSDKSGKPSGPLIEFLMTYFDLLAKIRPDLQVSRETIFDWIGRYRVSIYSNTLRDSTRRN